MQFNIDTNTMKLIKYLGGNFFAKGVRRYTRRGSYISLWLDVMDPNGENLDNFNKYEYQDIKINIEKPLYVAEIIKIRVRSYILWFPFLLRFSSLPRFDILGVALWPISEDGSVIIKKSENLQ